MVGKKVACATASPYLYTLSILQVHYWLFCQVRSDFGDSSDGIFHVKKIDIAEL